MRACQRGASGGNCEEVAHRGRASGLIVPLEDRPKSPAASYSDRAKANTNFMNAPIIWQSIRDGHPLPMRAAPGGPAGLQ